ncbi:MAG: hypothetical protein ABH829_00795 [archaeon]
MTLQTEFDAKKRELRDLCRQCNGKDKAREAQRKAEAIRDGYNKYHEAVGKWNKSSWELYYEAAVKICRECEKTSLKHIHNKGVYASSFREHFSQF